MLAKQLGRIAFYGAAVLTYSIAIIRFMYVPNHRQPHEEFAGRWKYLTYWNLWFQLVYFGFCLYMDLKSVSSSSSRQSKLTAFRDKFYAAVAMPYALFVFSVFWILYSINREYIFPRALDAIIPVWLNHVSHTFIVPILIFETWLVRHRHPRRSYGLVITVSIAAVYVSWILYLGLFKDIWVYPILQILNWNMRIAFFGVCAVFVMTAYLMGEKINHILWG